jgi:hypothetical protein
MVSLLKCVLWSSLRCEYKQSCVLPSKYEDLHIKCPVGLACWFNITALGHHFTEFVYSVYIISNVGWLVIISCC